MKHILFLIATCMMSLEAFGQESTTGSFFIAPSLFYSSGITSRNSKDESVELRADLRAAYQVYPSVYLGPIYYFNKEAVKTSGYSSDSLNNTSKSEKTGYGALLGYVTESYHFSFAYFLDSTWQLNTTTSTGDGKYVYKGTGLQLDVAYKIPIWSFFFGPQVSYKKITYSKLSTDGGSSQSISPKLEETGFEPSIVLYWFF